MTTYVLRGGSEGAKRLKVLAEASWPTTKRLLRQVGVKPGWRCLDVGCGNGHTTMKLAEMVGPNGRAIGLDYDAAVLDVAREEAGEVHSQVDFREGSVLDLADVGEYDLVYARFLLTHLADPVAGLANLVGATRPGGFVVVEDIDFHSYFSYPQNDAFDRYVGLYREAGLRKGADPMIGPKLVGMFLEAKLEDVQFETAEPLFRQGSGKLIPQLTMEHIRESVVAAGLASEAEIDDIIDTLNTFGQNPTSIMGYPRVFQVWGRRSMT